MCSPQRYTIHFTAVSQESVTPSGVSNIVHTTTTPQKVYIPKAWLVFPTKNMDFSHIFHHIVTGTLSTRTQEQTNSGCLCRSRVKSPYGLTNLTLKHVKKANKALIVDSCGLSEHISIRSLFFFFGLYLDDLMNSLGLWLSRKDAASAFTTDRWCDPNKHSCVVRIFWQRTAAQPSQHPHRHKHARLPSVMIAEHRCHHRLCRNPLKWCSLLIALSQAQHLALRQVIIK